MPDPHRRSASCGLPWGGNRTTTTGTDGCGTSIEVQDTCTGGGFLGVGSQVHSGRNTSDRDHFRFWDPGYRSALAIPASRQTTC